MLDLLCRNEFFCQYERDLNERIEKNERAVEKLQISESK